MTNHLKQKNSRHHEFISGSVSETLKCAFTLAEVLITLAIIGIVAALTIPTLVTNYQNHLNVVRLKKFYTTFQEALKQATLDENCAFDMACYYSSIGVTDNGNTQDRVDRALNSIAKQLNGLKKCENPTGTGFYTGCCTSYTINHNYDGSGNENNCYYNFITKDGMYVAYIASGSRTNGGWTTVDVNGKKGPNREGRDVFTFWNYIGNTILPPVDNDNCTNENTYGQSCAARIMKNSWKMDY